MKWITFVVQLIVLGSAFLPLWVTSGSAWELTTITGDSYSPPRFAISLRDHNIAFTSSVYCVTTVNNKTTIPNEFSRDLCEACASCAWKQRQGFTTELEWQAAVNAEMARLDSGDLGQVGSWIVEVPVTMELNLELMDELSSALGISLENLVVTAAAADGGTRRRYFVVSATPEHMDKAMLYAEFISATPIPPRLKIHPILEEAATVERATGLNDDVVLPPGLKGAYLTGRTEDGNEKLHGLYTQLAHAPPAPPLLSSAGTPHSQVTSISSAKNISDNYAEATRPGTCVHPLLHSGTFSNDAAMEWVGEVASRRGRAETAEVLIQGEHIVTVQGLHSSRAVVYAAALDIAMHGAVHWVAPHGPPPTSTGYYASKVSQKWPPPKLTRFQLPNRNSVEETSPLLDWADTPPPLHELGLRGQGAVVGVYELGPLDLNSCFFRDDDENVEVTFKNKKKKRGGRMLRYGEFESENHRKLRLYAVNRHLKKGEYAGFESHSFTHGTAVAGALAGKIADYNEQVLGEAAMVKKGEGVAPEAKLAYFFNYPDGVQNALRKHNVLKFIMPKNKVSWDLRAGVFPHAYSVGARVFSISWGYSKRYGLDSGSADAYLFRNQDFVVLIAAGNDGARADEEASSNLLLPKKRRGRAGTVLGPGDAKSVVTVGSHLNAIDQHMMMDLTRLNVLTESSSRGPTVDGRIKPDVCGPGENVIVPKAGGGGGGDDDYVHGTYESCEVHSKSGTSNSTPVLAGVTTLVRQYFTEGYYPWTGKKDQDNNNNKYEPMGALLKAILVNSARPLFLSAAGDAPQKNLPSMDQGWGGVDVSTTLITPSSPRGAALKVFGKWSPGCADCPQLYEDQSCEYILQIAKQQQDITVPLKITLVWFDYNASEHGRQKTYNNLDLSVTKQVDGGRSGGPPSGRDAASSSGTLFPNGRTDPDKKNTVEHIAVLHPHAGATYTVKVKGTSVPMPAQPFALVVSGPFDSSAVVEVKYQQHAPTSNLKRVMKKMKKKKNRRGRCGE